MIIDAHTHIDKESTRLSYIKRAKGRIGLAFVMHCCEDELLDVADYVNSKDDLKLIAAVEIKTPAEIAAQLDLIETMLKNKKAVGIKLYPGYQYFDASDPRIWPIAELCLKYDRPLAFHSGDVSDPQAVLRYANPLFIDDLAVRYPGLKIIICHFGFPFMMECANVASKNENVYIDISGTLENTNSKGRSKLLFKAYKNDLKKILAYFPEIRNKIIFGTDYGGEDTPLDEIDLYISLIEQLYPKKEQEWVFSALAEKLFLK